MRTCRDLGVETVAVYSDADVDAAHVRMADAAVRLGPALAGELLRQLRSSRPRCIVEAIHPGYGFLSDAIACAPRSTPGWSSSDRDPMRSRHWVTSRRPAGRRRRPASRSCRDVPPDRGRSARWRGGDPRAAETIRFPLFVKASAGGGGRGMRRVATAIELPAALAAGSAEAGAAFGDGAVYLEREIRAGASHRGPAVGRLGR